jgi:hypothetical protein
MGKTNAVCEARVQPEAHRGVVMNLFKLKRIVKRFAGVDTIPGLNDWNELRAEGAVYTSMGRSPWSVKEVSSRAKARPILSE